MQCLLCLALACERPLIHTFWPHSTVPGTAAACSDLSPTRAASEWGRYLRGRKFEIIRERGRPANPKIWEKFLWQHTCQGQSVEPADGYVLISVQPGVRNWEWCLSCHDIACHRNSTAGSWIWSGLRNACTRTKWVYEYAWNVQTLSRDSGILRGYDKKYSSSLLSVTY